MTIRISQLDQVQEHVENIGGPRVTIEPSYQSVIQQAVDFVNNAYPRLLTNVSDIFGHVESSGAFGEYKTQTPHSISVDIQSIEREVRNQLSGADEESIRGEILRQIIKTIIHEATHMQEYSDTGQSSESGPEQAEKDAETVLQQLSSRDIRKKADIYDFKFRVTFSLEDNEWKIYDDYGKPLSEKLAHTA